MCFQFDFKGVFKGSAAIATHASICDVKPLYALYCSNINYII